MPLRERLIDFAIPQRNFRRELDSEIEDCLDFFKRPRLVKGIGITIGRMGQEGRTHVLLDKVRGEPRGYFWEKDGIRHIVGREVMTRKQKEGLINAIHHITFPYAEFTELPPAKNSNLPRIY
jgi:hypothetical protein